MAAAAAAMALANIERAHQMYREGRHLEALESYTEALSVAKTKAQKIALHSNRAACYLKIHDFRKAAEECTSVLELDHQHTGALMLRAQTLVTLKEYQSALFDVNRLTDLNPSSEVYKNLQSRLKTQLSLAPIPESEEETLLEEEELDEEKGKKNIEVPLPDRFSESVPRVVQFLRTDNEAESSPQEAISEKDVNKLDDRKHLSDETVTTSSDMQETPKQIKDNESPTAIKEATVACKLDADKHANVKHATVNSKEQKVITQSTGHSRLDYSRWDQVDSDSSDDDDDDEDEEEEQPRYRFRVRTFGVCPVK